MELSTLELLILDALCLDYQVKDIHPLLGLSKQFINVSVKNIRKKFGVNTNPGLIYKYSLLRQTQK